MKFFIDLNNTDKTPINEYELQSKFTQIGNPAGLPKDELEKLGWAEIVKLPLGEPQPFYQVMLEPKAIKKDDGTWEWEHPIHNFTQAQKDGMLVSLKEQAIRIIKDTAYNYINRDVPMWKQNNMNHRTSGLALKVSQGGTLTTEEQSELDVIAGEWQKITDYQNKSEVLEATVPSLTYDEMVTSDFEDPTHWT